MKREGEEGRICKPCGAAYNLRVQTTNTCGNWDCEQGAKEILVMLACPECPYVACEYCHWNCSPNAANDNEDSQDNSCE